MTTAPTADGLAERLREHLWARGATIGGAGYEPVGAQEYPRAGINDARDVVLRSPDGTLWDVNIQVTISPRPTA